MSLVVSLELLIFHPPRPMGLCVRALISPVEKPATGGRSLKQLTPQSTQSDGPVRFLLFCSISISLLASLVAGRRPQCNAVAD